MDKDVLEERKKYILAQQQRELQKKENERILGTSFSDNAKNALKFGAGALALGTAAGISLGVLYRSGAASKMENFMNKASYFVHEVNQNTPEKIFLDWNIDDFVDSVKSVKAAYKKTQETFKNKPFRIDPYDRRTGFGLMTDMKNAIDSGGASIVNTQFRQTFLVNPMIEHYNKHYAKHFKEHTNTKFENFINTVSHSIHDKVAVAETIDKYGFQSELEKKAANDIVERMTARSRNREAKETIEKQMRYITRVGIFRKLVNPKEFGKSFGQESGFFDKLWNMVTGERAVTNRDILENKDKFTKSLFATIQVNHESIKPGKIKKTAKEKTYDVIEQIESLRNYARETDRKLRESGKQSNLEETFLNLALDPKGLRINANGEMYSTQWRRDVYDAAISAAANTIPGKILKLRQIQYASRAPKFLHIAEGSYDPILAAMTNKEENRKSSRVDSTMFRINDDYYRFIPSEYMDEMNGEQYAKLEKIEGLEKSKLISGRFGLYQRQLKIMAGDIRHKESENSILKHLDMMQNLQDFEGFNFKDRFDAWKNRDKDPYYVKNIIANLDKFSTADWQTLEDAYKSGDIQVGINFLRKAYKVHDFLKTVTYGFDADVAKELEKNASEDAKKYFQMLQIKDDKELLQAVIANTTEDGEQYILKNFTRRLGVRGTSALEIIKHKVSQERSHIGSDFADIFSSSYGQEGNDFYQLLRTEISKEAMLQEAHLFEDEFDYGKALDLIEKSDLGFKDKNEALRTAHLGIFEFRSKIDATRSRGKFDPTLPEDHLEWEKVFGVTKAYTMGNDRASAGFKSVLQDIKSEQFSMFDFNYESEIEQMGSTPYNEWITIRESTGVLDILKSLNDKKKFEATTKRFFTQFAAGRDNMQDVSAATLAPFFMLTRLSEDMNVLGLGFSKDSMQSTGQMLKNIMTKRVIPAYLGLTYLEWADDTAEAITGMSFSGALAGGLANVDIAARKVLDFTGATEWLKQEKEINPIMQYWGGHDEFMSADERKDYYARGYDPVRKGAWWTFGSVNEARGGEIQYWQPNFVRRIQSDYKDKSLYDGYFDKWSHSWIPTPANPLSPLFALIDPYWLEEKHSEDRPYEVSGNLFEDNTLYGAILNPTIGRLIKPHKELHPWRNINGIDPKALLYAINTEIKQKVKDLSHTNYVQIKGSQFTPVSIDNFNMPTDSTKILSINFQDGKAIKSYNGIRNLEVSAGSNSDLISLDDVEAISNKQWLNFTDAFRQGVFGVYNPADDVSLIIDNNGMYGLNAPFKKNKTSGLKLEDKVAISRLTGGESIFNVLYSAVNTIKNDSSDFSLKNFSERLIFSLTTDGNKKILQEAAHNYNSCEVLRDLNNGLKIKGKQKAKSHSIYEADPDEDIVSPEKLKSYRPTNAMELLNDTDTVSELINRGYGSEFVAQSATSLKLLSGIYGYMLNATTGFGDDSYKRIATSQDMTSLSRAFWDSNIGGAGGGVMEIVRRFIPDFRRNAKINPLLNTMPEWLPDRFKYGDPYTILPKGEMRLPGKGFEALNTLHPDAYGEYGAFDRMKILADIAPFSPEYKLWKTIAKKTITDPALIQEMSEIQNRVNQQGKKHDFFDYKIIGHGLEYKNVIVSEIMDYGKFRSGNTIYKIAGTSIKGNAQETMKEVLGKYIHVGQEVTVAVDEDDNARQNNDTIGSIGAAVFVDNENIGQMMISSGDAKVRKGDNSAAAILAKYGPMQKGLAWASEKIAHMDIPWISSQFLRVRDSLESYKDEQVYGTPYSSWSRPIDSMLMPAIERAIHERNVLPNLIKTANIPGLNKTTSNVLRKAFYLSDRGAFIGAALNWIITGSGKNAYKWARYGSAAAMFGHVLSGGSSAFDEASSAFFFAKGIGEFFKAKNKYLVGAAGSGIALMYRGLFKDDVWIPDRIKKKYEMQEYFDRLTYIKFMGLYHQAAEKAKDEEDVDIEDIIERKEREERLNKNFIDSLKNTKKKLMRKTQESPERDNILDVLNQKIKEVEDEKTLIPVGEWARTAMLYKQAADNTMRGLNKNSTWSQIVTALPTNDREYFMEFVKAKGEDKREEILKYASPSLQKALRIAWGQNLEDEETDEEFFEKHELPVNTWAGWAPQVDLKDVAVKTIENEGMLLGDFGYYESQLRDEKVINAPSLQYHINSSDYGAADIKRNLKDALQGSGLTDIDISVTPGPTGGVTSIIAAVKTMMGKRYQRKRIEESLLTESVY